MSFREIASIEKSTLPSHPMGCELYLGLNAKTPFLSTRGLVENGRWRVLMTSFTGPIDYGHLTSEDKILTVFACPGDLKLAEIPPWIDSLHLYRCSTLTSLVGLPASIEYLILDDCQELTSLDGYVAPLLAHQGSLPESVIELTLDNLPKLVWGSSPLPHGLRNLLLSRVALGRLSLGQELEHLSLRWIEDPLVIDGTPARLRSLSLINVSRVADLSWLPEGIASLQLTNCPLVERLPYRRSLTMMTIDERAYHVQTMDGLGLIPESTVRNYDEYVALLDQYEAHVSSRKKRAKT